uniref:Disease resistance R13L4/SHOC-2-like LRR domain-containing protein n=1 Tax=Oryza brachyantha TaxID=4533 RepID=J3KZQ5_ORYBR
MVKLLGIDYSEDGIREEYCCRVHFSVMDLISSLPSEENFATILNDKQKPCSSDKSVDTEDKATTSLSKVRSISVSSPDVGSIHLAEFKVFRVLDLEGCDLSQNHRLLSNQLGGLLHLRYTGLRDTRITEVPEDVGDLQFLQTLDLAETRVEALPAVVFRLGNLACLRVEHRMRVPRGIGSLVSLQELSDVSTRDSPDVVRELGDLMRLRVLRITLWRPTRSAEEAMVESLWRLRRLRELHVYVASGGAGGDETTLDLLKDGGPPAPPRALRSFSAGGTYVSSAPLRWPPSWIDAAPAVASAGRGQAAKAQPVNSGRWRGRRPHPHVHAHWHMHRGSGTAHGMSSSRRRPSGKGQDFTDEYITKFSFPVATL